tara:strand:+ start:15677 stop:15850 length:174 start_codon:yes stop_codon:yes gene_type:complete
LAVAINNEIYVDVIIFNLFQCKKIPIIIFGLTCVNFAKIIKINEEKSFISNFIDFNN